MPENKEEADKILQGRTDGRDAFGNAVESIWRCDTCHDECDWVNFSCFFLHSRKQTSNLLILCRLQDKIHPISEEAFEKVQSVMNIYKSDEKSMARKLSDLEDLVASISYLHPYNECFFQVNLALINLYSAVSNWKKRLKSLQYIIHIADNVFPEYFLPCQTYFRAIVNTVIPAPLLS